MKSRYLLEILNYEQPCIALDSLGSIDASADGFDPADMCRDFWIWRSKNKNQIDIYFQISETDTLDCIALMRTNLSIKAQVYLYGSNSGGISGFNSPIFTRSMSRKNDNWLFFSDTPLPSAMYYKLTIVEDESSPTDYVEIGKLLAGKTAEFPLQIIDGFTNSKESYQKRDVTAGQWRPGSENSMLNMLDITFRPAVGTRTIRNNEYDLIFEMEKFIQEVKTSRPFLVILNPTAPTDFFDYMTIDGDEIEISCEEAEMTTYAFSLKELK